MIQYDNLFYPSYSGVLTLADETMISFIIKPRNWVAELEIQNITDKQIEWHQINADLKTILMTEQNIPLIIKIISLGTNLGDISTFFIDGKSFLDSEGLSIEIKGVYKSDQKKMSLALLFEAVYELVINKYYKTLSVPIIKEYFHRITSSSELLKYDNLPNPVLPEKNDSPDYDELVFQLMETAGTLPRNIVGRISLAGLLIYHRYRERKEVYNKMENLNMLKTLLLDNALTTGVVSMKGGNGSSPFDEMLNSYRNILGQKKLIKRKTNMEEVLREINEHKN